MIYTTTNLRLLIPALVISAVTIQGCSSGSETPDTGDKKVTLHDEATAGDISSDRNNPLPLQLASGTNRIVASMVAPDTDYITVNVPANMALSGLIVSGFVSTDSVSFIGLQNSSVFTEPANGADVANLLGYKHFGLADLNNDILADVGTGGGAQGFTPPLAAGDYTFWIQETGQNNVDYQIDFVVTDAN